MHGGPLNPVPAPRPDAEPRPVVAFGGPGGRSILIAWTATTRTRAQRPTSPSLSLRRISKYSPAGSTRPGSPRPRTWQAHALVHHGREADDPEVTRRLVSWPTGRALKRWPRCGREPCPVPPVRCGASTPCVPPPRRIRSASPPTSAPARSRAGLQCRRTGGGAPGATEMTDMADMILSGASKGIRRRPRTLCRLLQGRRAGSGEPRGAGPAFKRGHASKLDAELPPAHQDRRGPRYAAALAPGELD
jgi:hypothetical protein